MAIISVDTSNCYDRIQHTIISLVFSQFRSVDRVDLSDVNFYPNDEVLPMDRLGGVKNLY